MKKIIATVLLVSATLFMLKAQAKDFILYSPDNSIKVSVSVTGKITWAIDRNNENVLKPSPLAMSFTNGMQLGIDPVVLKTETRSANTVITAIVAVKNKNIPDVYNELTLRFKNKYNVVFRVYNEGAAYRFETKLGNEMLEVKNETATFNFNEGYQAFWPKESDPTFQSHYEALFADTAVSAINAKTHGFLPILFTSKKGTRLLVTEADLYDYPNMFLFGTNSASVTAGFPPVNLELSQRNDRSETIVKKADYIAKTTGNRTYPWRVCIVTDDKGLLESEMVYKLSTPNVLTETAWIKPGKVAWDWWNYNNIYGVDFKAGINTATYKYYIDFAAEYGLEYIMLDEGWSKTTTNIMEPAPEVDIVEIVRYGKEKKVDVILWALWGVLNKDVTGILNQYEKWGIKGVKVDFMKRADQDMVNIYEMFAVETAKRKMLIDYHGSYKPSGLNRKYPNVIGFEGVRGSESNKGSYVVTPKHDVTLPFTRMVAGFIDYTPGAMINGTQDDFRPVFKKPMSQGTRAHQVAMFVVYEAPLQMLADNPSNYRKDPECTKFISRFPTVWDKTVALESKAGEYVAIARKNSNNWYIGAMTDWNPRELTIKLDFLDGKKYKLELLKDGINADRYAADYKLETLYVTAGESLKINMGPGGGWAAILTPVGE